MNWMYRKFLIISVILLLVFGLVMILIYPTWLNVGTMQRSLSSEFSPTAEYILNHPDPTPQFIDSINPPIGTVIKGSEEICINVLPGEVNNNSNLIGDASRNLAGSLRIILNTQFYPSEAVRVQVIDTLQRSEDGNFSGKVNACFTPNLQAGFHILQLEMRNSPLGVFDFGELFTYTWAYLVG